MFPYRLSLFFSFLKDKVNCFFIYLLRNIHWEDLEGSGGEGGGRGDQDGEHMRKKKKKDIPCTT